MSKIRQCYLNGLDYIKGYSRAISNLASLVDQYEKDQTNRDLRARIITIAQDLDGRVDRGHRLSMKVGDVYTGLISRLHSLAIIDYLTLEAVPYNAELGRGDRRLSESLHRRDMSVEKKSKGISITYLKSEYDASTREAYNHDQVHNVGDEVLEDQDGINLVQFFGEEIAEGKRKLKDIQTSTSFSPELKDRYQQRLLFLQTLSDSIKCQDRDFTIDQATKFKLKADEIENAVYCNQIRLEFAKSIYEDDETFKQYTIRLGKINSLVNKINKLIDQDSWEGFLGYQLQSDNQRISMLTDTIDAFLELTKKVDLSKAEVAKPIAELFNRFIKNLAIRIGLKEFKTQTVPDLFRFYKLLREKSSFFLTEISERGIGEMNYKGNAATDMQEMLSNNFILELRDYLASFRTSEDGGE